MTIDAMDQGQVSQSLISAWHGPQGSLISNEEVLSFVQRHPDHLFGVATADLNNPVQAVRVRMTS